MNLSSQTIAVIIIAVFVGVLGLGLVAWIVWRNNKLLRLQGLKKQLQRSQKARNQNTPRKHHHHHPTIDPPDAVALASMSLVEAAKTVAEFENQPKKRSIVKSNEDPDNPTNADDNFMKLINSVLRPQSIAPKKK
jgi:predicted negative regulator of RcsB-dependent stress response